MKAWKKAVGCTCAAMLMTTMFAGCGGAKKDAAKSDEIVIGAHFELTGGVANYGKSTLNGVQLAIEQANAKGGVLGKKIKLVQGDNKSEPAEAGNIATKLITADHAVVLIGPATSGCVAASAPIATANKVPLMAPVATAPGITVGKDGKVKPFVFRACFIDPFQGKVMAVFAEKTLKVKKVAILFDSSSEYSKGLTAVFTKTLEANGGQVVDKEAFLAKDVDFKATLTKIKASNPEAIYVPAYYEEVSKIIKQAREVGLTCPILGSDGWDSPKLAEIAGKEALNNTYFCSAYSAQDKEPGVQNFIKAYKAKYNAEPDNFSIHGYDAALVVIEAIKRAGSTDGVKIAQELSRIKDFPVATGKFTVDADHNPVSGAVIIELKDGVQTFKEKITL
ncbi:MAG: ABC transporter substrate-binding protein [Acidaminococcaceae bacterium]|nr:ABC transporter substrate-binding protein [Acidaminococcaceae bacterium]